MQMLLLLAVWASRYKKSFFSSGALPFCHPYILVSVVVIETWQNSRPAELEVVRSNQGNLVPAKG